jgi:hypothetical protein
MICRRRPGTPTSSRVGSSAVGLLLLLTLSSFRVCEADFASAAASGADAAFDEDVALSSPAEKAKAAAMSPGINLRAEEDADSPPKPRRSLGLLNFMNDTSSAPLSAGNNNTECGGLTDCINGCRSHFFKLTGGAGLPIFASTCFSTSFAQRLYIWKGSSSDCSTFTCTGTRAAWLVRFGSVGALRECRCRSLTQIASSRVTHSGQYLWLRY